MNDPTDGRFINGLCLNFFCEVGNINVLLNMVELIELGDKLLMTACLALLC